MRPQPRQIIVALGVLLFACGWGWRSWIEENRRQLPGERGGLISSREWLGIEAHTARSEPGKYTVDDVQQLLGVEPPAPVPLRTYYAAALALQFTGGAAAGLAAVWRRLFPLTP